MVDLRGETIVVVAAATLLLLMSAANSQAQSECHEASRDCRHESTTRASVCRQDCEVEIRNTIASAQAVCDEESLDEEACRRLIHESVGAVANECRSACHAARKDDRTRCREAHQECRDALINGLDDECVASCRDEFAPCIDEQQRCHDDCFAGVEDAVAVCNDSELEFRDKLMCLREARQAGHVCKLSCHDDNACHGDIRACLNECSDDELAPAAAQELTQRRRGGSRARYDRN